jgi:uncharacterized protein YggE
VLASTGISQLASAKDDPTPRIVVSGEGHANITPDLALLNLSVVREATTAKDALTANTAAMQKVLDAMQKLGIAKRDLQTSNFDIQPRYSYPQAQGPGANTQPQLVGYTVRNGLAVRVRDLNKLGELLDTSVTLGVNEGGNITFTNDDPSAAISQARVKAVQDAMARAKTLAEAANVKLGQILEISEQKFTPQPVPMARMKSEMVAADAAVPIAVGENSYSVTVTVSLAIAQ